jgi:hypothetical protein
MREARIILPKTDNRGLSLAAIHSRLALDLVDTFGGATAADTHGLWRNGLGVLHVEDGTAYDVAVDDNPENVAKLRDIATAYGKAADQEAVYLRLPSGDVEIIETAARIAA